MRLHRIGELTRGTCIVDRRGAQAPLLNCVATGSIGSAGFGPFESVSVPPRVEIEGESLIPCEDEQGGVPVVEGTPGMGALLHIMLKRIWGVLVDEESLATDQLLV
jgi:hypothetical protein